jgi:Phosphoglycerol transferase and related proteins, alkaline phosphatase superfamily
MYLSNLFIQNKYFIISLLILFFTETVILLSNVIYYREFSDFISVDTILGAQKLTGAMSKSIITLLLPRDCIYFLNLLLIILIPIFSKNLLSNKPERLANKMALIFVSLSMVIVNLTISEMNRPQLLGRTFDQTYIVKYLGLNFYTAYNSINKVNEDTEKIM